MRHDHAGGLGHIGIQVLKASLADLIVVDRNPDALTLAREIGADITIVADGTEAAGAGPDRRPRRRGRHRLRRRGRLDGRGLDMTRRAGDYHVVGYGENVDIANIDIISTERNTWLSATPGSCQRPGRRWLALAARGKVTLHTATYALDDFQQAIDDLDAGKVRGRVILVP